MYKRTLTVFILLMLNAGVPAVMGQSTPAAAPRVDQTPKPPKTPKPDKVPVATPAPRVADEEPVQVEPVSVKLARGGKVAISSRSGQIIISGWDRDVVEASATGENGPVQVEVQTTGDPARPRLLLTISARRFGRDARLDVKVPRYADVETLEGYRGEIEVADVEGATLINAGNGDVKIMRTGPLKVSRRSGDVIVREVKGDLTARSYNGDVVVDNVSGLVDVAATNGGLTVRNTGGDVRANSLTGDVEVRCAKGRAEVSSASGSITLIGIGGDVDASTASADVIFTGPIRGGGSYRLKSLSGGVSMTIQPEVAGFTATLTTYSGEIDTDFPLRVESPVQGGPINRRITGTFGNGQAKLALDSFSGTVKIAKGTAAALKECK
jgi:putative adhesin